MVDPENDPRVEIIGYELAKMIGYTPAGAKRRAVKLLNAADAVDPLRATPHPPPGEIVVTPELFNAISNRLRNAGIGGPRGEIMAQAIVDEFRELCALDPRNRAVEPVAGIGWQTAEPVTLAQCPVGLFRFGDTLVLKTEYGNNEGRIDAYIVETGEFFWGDPPQTIKSQRAQIVYPLLPPPWATVARTAQPFPDGCLFNDPCSKLNYCMHTIEGVTCPHSDAATVVRAEIDARRTAVTMAATDDGGPREPAHPDTTHATFFRPPPGQQLHWVRAPDGTEEVWFWAVTEWFRYRLEQSGSPTWTRFLERLYDRPGDGNDPYLPGYQYLGPAKYDPPAAATVPPDGRNLETIAQSLADSLAGCVTSDAGNEQYEFNTELAERLIIGAFHEVQGRFDPPSTPETSGAALELRVAALEAAIDGAGESVSVQNRLVGLQKDFAGCWDKFCVTLSRVEALERADPDAQTEGVAQPAPSAQVARNPHELPDDHAQGFLAHGAGPRFTAEKDALLRSLSAFSWANEPRDEIARRKLEMHKAAFPEAAPVWPPEGCPSKVNCIARNECLHMHGRNHDCPHAKRGEWVTSP